MWQTAYLERYEALAREAARQAEKKEKAVERQAHVPSETVRSDESRETLEKMTEALPPSRRRLRPAAPAPRQPNKGLVAGAKAIAEIIHTEEKSTAMRRSIRWNMSIPATRTGN